MNIKMNTKGDIYIANTLDVARIMRKVLLRQNRLHRKKEYFWTIGLNSNHDIEYIELITIGTLNQTILDPVEIFNFAVAKKCKVLIICHNRPSGNVKPSESDLQMTAAIKKGADVLHITLLDHIIISEGKEYYSMREHKNLEYLA